LLYHFGHCGDPAGAYSDSLSQFYCPEDQFNDLASLMAVSYAISMKQLLHFTSDASFTPFSLCMFFVAFCIFACWTYGIAVPSGLCVPSQLSGAAYCWICVMIVLYLGLPVGAHDGMFVLIDSASIPGGMACMTISLTCIILECTGVIKWGLPIMVSLMAARWVGNSFDEELYDIHIYLNHLPSSPTCVPQIANVSEIFDVPKDCNHGGFPVVKPRRRDAAGGGHRAIPGAKSKFPRFAGIINRYHPCVLLQRKDYFIEKLEPLVRTPAGYATLLYNDQSALSHRDVEGSYPRYPSIHEIQLDEDERDL
ncbi:hypothetical protein BBJ28_00025748, partial [Nothophytophthora sp. Chile5]